MHRLTTTAEVRTAELHWTGSRDDLRAIAQRADWSQLSRIDQLWPVLAERHGDAVAVEAPHANPPERFSYRELSDRIDIAAAALAQWGVGPGDVVALVAENGPRWLIADQAIMRCGASDAVRGATAPLEELRYILDDSAAVGLVVESAALLERLALTAEQVQRLRFVLVLQDERGASTPAAAGGPRAWHSWDDLLARGAGAPPPLAGAATGPSGMATVLYTSGTTGQPKGVPLSHTNLLHQLRSLGVAVNPRPGDRVLSVLPIWHAYERSAEYFLFSCGCRQTYTTLKQLRTDLQAVRPHYLISVPRLWEALLSGFSDALTGMPAARQRLISGALANSRAWCLARRRALDLTLVPETAGVRLAAAAMALLRWPAHALAARLIWPKVRGQLVGGRLRTAISGGGALAMHVDGFFEAIGIELLVGYGLTETSPVLSCRRRWCNRRGSSGQPLPGTAIRIVDPERRTSLGVGERGLVLARGPQVMAGYLGKPDATATVLDAEGWFDTGDLGCLLADGSLVLTGRAKDTIVLSSGENIEPGPLEDCLVADELVEQVMLVGQDRKALGALVVPRPDPMAAFAAAQGVPLHHPAVLKALTGQLNRRLQGRAGARPDERLAGVALVEPFTIDNGLLTQTLKQRRDRIAARDVAAIDAIYTR
ncbi:MAG: AMP-binding protein [Cyanobacteria bacterium REEB417]|nr:AMP-binding protein [Cyanobacteria bacterium REEB417]